MALWPCNSPSKASDVSAELDDIIKRLASGSTSPDPDFEPNVSESYNNNNEGIGKCLEKCDLYGENTIESGAENVCGVEESQRSPRPPAEPASTINTDDVRSRDACLEKACSAGSYARRKHQKRHKRDPTPPPAEPPKTKINPVFVWVRQENCRILEVMCEDYDQRNRLRIAKTPLGWRAIPKTDVFSAAVIPKVPKPPKSERRKKHKKSRKKKKKERSHSVADSVVKECSVSLVRTELETCKPLDEPCVPEEDPEIRIRREVDEEMVGFNADCVSKMTKSSSCNFPAESGKPSLVRSSSLNFSITSIPTVQKLPAHEELGIKMEEDLDGKVLDMTKEGDLDDNDCDELGLLLKEIPDLEFEEEDDVNAVAEFEEFGLPKDLTVPKTKQEPQLLPQLPANISSLVTVTSSIRPPQPLTAPLPEVTITPIPNPKPAHQQRPQNKYLESLLSDRTVKNENLDFFKAKPTKRPHEGSDEIKAKNIKMDDLTLRNLLVKQNYEEKARTKTEVKARLTEMLTREVDPMAQLKQVLSNPELAVPDPLLVPRARLPALVASPASEIPRLLKEKKIKEPPRPPIADPDTLVVSLSHLQSLLAYKCNNTDDLTAYQKSLEAFLEWQRYQTELMEAQVKASTPLTPGDIDMATANALNQMLWLPYLNQLDANRDLMGFLNTVCSPYGQSSPFLTPTSPMEGHMKTLAMWQEALMAQQGTKLSSPSPPESRMKVPPPVTPPRKRPNSQMHGRPNSYEQMLQQQVHMEYRRQQEQQHKLLQQRQQQQRHQEKLARQRAEQQRIIMQQQQQQQQQQHMFQMQQMQQNFNNFHNDISKQLKLDLEKKPRSPPALKPLDRREGKKSSWCKFEEDIKKSAELTNQMARQWQQFEEEMRKSQIQITKNQKKIKSENSDTSECWPQLDDKKTVETKPEVKDNDLNNAVASDSPVPKLKVKNLVELSESPPKLLKVAPTEHLMGGDSAPLADDPHSSLWHPLFGSNPQGKTTSYSSPWRWTTVTVNGE